MALSFKELIKEKSPALPESNSLAPNLPKDKGGAVMLNDVFSKFRDFSVDKKLRAKFKAKSKAKKTASKKIFDVEKSADAILEAGESIDLKPDGGVSIGLDLNKLPKSKDGKRLTYGEIIPPGIKGFKLKIPKTDGVKGKSYVAFRKPIKSGDLGFYYHGDDGKDYPLPLNIEGKVSIHISPEDYEDITPDALQKILAEQSKIAATKALSSKKVHASIGATASAVTDDIFGSPAPRRSVQSHNSRNIARNASSPSRPQGSSPSPRSQRSYPSGIPAQVSRLVKGNVETVKVGKYTVAITRDKETNEILSIKSGTRLLSGPISPDALAMFKTMRPDEPMVKTKNPVEPNRTIKLRKSVYDLYNKANEYAMKDGFFISPYSTWRSKKAQAGIHARSSDPGRLAAAPGQSHHHRGATMDARAYHYKPGSPKHLKRVSKEDGYAVLSKYLSMVGFVNYTVEGWHHELFNPRWAAMMVAAKYLPDDTDIAAFVHPRVMAERDIAFVDVPPLTQLA